MLTLVCNLPYKLFIFNLFIVLSYRLYHVRGSDVFCFAYTTFVPGPRNIVNCSTIVSGNRWPSTVIVFHVVDRSSKGNPYASTNLFHHNLTSHINLYINYWTPTQNISFDRRFFRIKYYRLNRFATRCLNRNSFD